MPARWLLFGLIVSCTSTPAAPSPGRKPEPAAPVVAAPTPLESSSPPLESSALPPAPQPSPAPSVDPFQPVVSDMPETCRVDDEPIDTEFRKPDWCTSQALPLESEVAQRALAKVLGKRLRRVGSSVLVDDVWQATRATDSLEVKRAPDGTVSLEVLINFANDHTCELTARLEVLDERTFRLVADGCLLKAQVRGPNLVFGEESPERCATANYCGARGGFLNTTFRLRGPVEVSP